MQEKGDALLNYLIQVFQPHPTEDNFSINSIIESPFQVGLLIKKITLSDVKTVTIKH